MGTSFGTKIKRRRVELDLSLRKVCENVLSDEGKKISVSYLNDIEQDHRNPPNGKIVVQLAKVLDLDERELLNLAGKPDPIIENIAENAKVGALFRRIAEEYKSNPALVDKLNKVIDEMGG